jgi:hypothetical protein
LRGGEEEEEKLAQLVNFNCCLNPQTTFFTKLRAKSPPNELTSEAT